MKQYTVLRPFFLHERNKFQATEAQQSVRKDKLRNGSELAGSELTQLSGLA